MDYLIPLLARIVQNSSKCELGLNYAPSDSSKALDVSISTLRQHLVAINIAWVNIDLHGNKISGPMTSDDNIFFSGLSSCNLSGNSFDCSSSTSTAN